MLAPHPCAGCAVTETVSTPSGDRSWLTQLLSRKPHQVSANAGQPYLLRYFLIKPNRSCNIYFHRFIGSDDPTSYDHPWSFISICLRGSYVELDNHGGARRRSPGSVVFRPATWRHSVQLERNTTEHGATEIPCSTVIITGPHRRNWGFWCPGERFVPRQQFGPGGCGETTAPLATTIPEGHSNGA